MQKWVRKDIAGLGTYKLSGKSCLAIKKLNDINPAVLKTVTKKYFADVRKKYKTDQ